MESEQSTKIKYEGLTEHQVKKLQKEYGPNLITEKNKVTPLKIFLRQFSHNYVLYLLTVAAIISLLVGKHVTAYVIFGVTVLVVSVGFFLEYRAEKAVQELKSMVERIANVIRNKKIQQIPSSELVPGDIVVLKNGEYIPADCIVLEDKNLFVNEAVLTGEAREVNKTATENNETDENKLYTGSYIVNGKCYAKVIGIGMETRFGKIAEMITDTEKDMPLQIEINSITKYMVILAVIFASLTAIFMVLNAGSLTEEVLVEALIVAIALSVSAVPEGLPVVLVTTLASGAIRMARQNALVNRMSTIGTIGEVTVICSDKTGTITKGEMTVKKIYTYGQEYEVEGGGYANNGKITQNNQPVNVNENEHLKKLITAAIFCNDARIIEQKSDGEYKIEGSPTEAALLIAGMKAGYEKDDLTLDRREEIPFSSSRKIMSVLGSDNILYSKGAPEVILTKSTRILHNGNGIDLSQEERNKIHEYNTQLTDKSFRTLALAFKHEATLSTEEDENNFIFIGLVAIEDPPREEVKAAIRECIAAGIKVKMITGDNKGTALAVANEIDLKGNILEGHELDTLTDKQLKKLVQTTAVFARVRPEHKVRIVHALKSNKEIVAMTGDGVNDAPALKEAHVGIAMGKNGTDVSRSVADITLKDDNFATIVIAIREGRGIFENIRTFVGYQLSCNLAQLTLIFLSVLLAPYLGWTIPLLVALQILFVNLITDNLPSITLGLMPPASDIMRRNPHRNGLLTPYLIRTIIFSGLVTGLTVIGIYAYYKDHLGSPHEIARTVAFVTFICIALSTAFSFRSARTSIIKQFHQDNLLLISAVVMAIIATVGIMYTPLRSTFEITPLTLSHWGTAVAGMIFSILCFEIYKALLSPKQ